MRPQSPAARNSAKEANQSLSRGYFSEETIAALATASGGAIAVVRISGPAAFKATQVLAPQLDLENLEPRKLFRAQLFDESSRALDDALISRFVAPQSFTGEHVVELHIHGSSFVAQRILETLGKSGVRQALPGEFSFRAVRNGKMALSEAEAVADLIRASNDGAVQLALEKMSGTQNRLIGDFASDLRRVAVLSEAGIDFADQDLEEVSLPALKRQLETPIQALRKLRDTYERGIRIQEGVKVAFIGLPNAGKSSFFNSLLGEERSIVSEIAGTTRDVVKEQITLRGKKGNVTLRLEDTAGLRSTHDKVEKMGIERTEKSAREADLLLLVVDPLSPLEPVIEQWKSLGAPAERTLGILTKADLAPGKAIEEALSQCKPTGIQTWIRTSSISGEGISQAADAVIEYCHQWLARPQGEVVLTRLDHLKAVSDTLAHLDRALQASELDLFAADIRQSLYSLSGLIGDTLPDDILGQIFSDFCIGK